MGKKDKRKKDRSQPLHEDRNERAPSAVDQKYPVLSRWLACLERVASESVPQLPNPVPQNCDETVLGNDIKRCLWHVVSENPELTDRLRAHERERLRTMVIRSLNGLEGFHYYQGLHELLSVVTLCEGCETPTEIKDVDSEKETLTVRVCRAIVQSHLQPFCTKSMDSTEEILSGLHEILCQETGHGRLVQLLETSGVGPDSHYALSWLITWFTHSLDETPKLVTLFDFLLQGDRYRILFVCASLILKNEEFILERIFEPLGDLSSDEFGVVYAQMSALPKTAPKFHGELGEVCSFAQRLEEKWFKAALSRIEETKRERKRLLDAQEERKRAMDEALNSVTEGSKLPSKQLLETGSAPTIPKAPSVFENVGYIVATTIFIAAAMQNWIDPKVGW